MHFTFDGEMPPYLLAKDLILQVIGDIGVAGANYRALEIDGEAIAKMSMEERMTLCNMAIEAGSENAVMSKSIEFILAPVQVEKSLTLSMRLNY
jgi:3-isopropylmalate/(R)-2-methylmalate dehydratase large subunit